MEDKKDYRITIYEKSDSIDINEVKQGDIFKNIPYYCPDFLKRSQFNQDLGKLKDESIDIFSNVMKTGGVELVESIIFPTWAILASQDCDIREGYDLIFYPIVKYKEPLEHDDFKKFVEKDIRDWNRYMFLPKNYIEKPEIGPFRILFQSPFYISYEIIEKNLRYSWVSHINKSAIKVFQGKITHFFTRTPIDELIFLDRNEIEEYFKQKWQKCWKDINDKPYEKSASSVVQKVIELYFSLKSEKNETIYENLKIIDITLIENMCQLMEKSWILNEIPNYRKKYKDFFNNKMENYHDGFFKVIDYMLFEAGSGFDEFINLNLKLKSYVQDSPEFLKFAEEELKNSLNKMKLSVLQKIVESIITQKEKYLSYYEPFIILREFLSKIGVIG